MTLTRDQADVLTAYGQMAADILLVPDTGISDARSSMRGSYGGGWTTPVWNWDTTSAGIVAWRCPGGQRGDVVLTWALLRAAAQELPDRERDALSRARRDSRRCLMQTVAPFVAGGQAPFVQPPPQWRREADQALRDALAAACDALAPADELALFDVTA